MARRPGWPLTKRRWMTVICVHAAMILTGGFRPGFECSPNLMAAGTNRGYDFPLMGNS